MPYYPTSVTASIGVGQLAGKYSEIGGALIGTAGAAYDAYRAFQLGSGSNARFQQGLAVANLVTQIGSTVPVFAPFLALQAVANVQLGLAHDYFAKEAAKHEARRALNKIRDTFARSVGGGHAPAIAARLAIARVGLNPEQFVPLGSPFAQFNPRTGAVDTEGGLLLDWGEGPEADAARAAHADEINAQLSARRAPGFGMAPGPFVQLRRAA